MQINDIKLEGFTNKEKAEIKDLCELCGKEDSSEYHMSDECVNLDEDDDRGDRYIIKWK